MLRKYCGMLLLALVVGCSRQQAATPVAPAAAAVAATEVALTGDATGKDWATATPEQKLAFCRISMKSYVSSGTSSFSVSVRTNSLTPDRLCKEIDDYFSKKGAGLQTDRIGQAAGMAVIFAGKPYKAPK